MIWELLLLLFNLPIILDNPCFQGIHYIFIFWSINQANLSNQFSKSIVVGQHPKIADDEISRHVFRGIAGG
jgi:hypothetical protein